ncbi:MAG: TRZ/ATZ family hydrolase [Gammaproteobacteria bacterium]|nr:TRZ/ATZ family hydrolase [Gammaproteobacteria bacterium]
MQADLLIHADWVIPVEPTAVLEGHSVAVEGGKIAAILPRAAARGQIQPREVVDLPGHALIPGLINAHTHSPMSLFRGLADDLPLMRWLNEHIWPAEARWVHEEFVADGTRLTIAEMLRGGTTCFNDMYFFPDVTARVASHVGVRATVGLIVIDFPSTWAADADAYFDRALALHDQLRNDPLVRTAFAPHAPYSVSDAPMKRVLRLANELELPIHMHVHETHAEVAGSLDQHGCRPLERLRRMDLITPSLIGVHMTQLDDDEIALYAQSGAHVVHCPQSNLKLASGHCPVTRLREAGVNVALGTDGAASNNDLDMFAEMQTAALLAKGVGGDACSLPAEAVLQMATLDGARALGIDVLTGSLTVGKSADIVAIDLGAPETQPVYHPVSQIVYAAGREQVQHVWIQGRHLLNARRLSTIDLDDTLNRAAAWRDRIHAADVRGGATDGR